MNKKQIKLLVLDVDGTLTDGKVYLSASGEIFKVFSIKDGYAIHDLLPKAKRQDGTVGIIPAVITGRESNIVTKRCDELGIRYVYQGVSNKIEKMSELLKMLDLSYENVAFIGDDNNDLECIKKAAVTGCPSDASNEVKLVSDFISSQKGGEGAVREFIEWLCPDGTAY